MILHGVSVNASRIFTIFAKKKFANPSANSWSDVDPTVPSVCGAHRVKRIKTSDVNTSDVLIFLTVRQCLFYVSLVHLAPVYVKQVLFLHQS